MSHCASSIKTLAGTAGYLILEDCISYESLIVRKTRTAGVQILYYMTRTWAKSYNYSQGVDKNRYWDTIFKFSRP